jgi:hypothetical protein
VAFFGQGDVIQQLTRLQMRRLKPSYGMGIRFLFNKKRKINIRADMGIGQNTSGIYFGMEEAF